MRSREALYLETEDVHLWLVRPEAVCSLELLGAYESLITDAERIVYQSARDGRYRSALSWLMA